MKTLFHPRWLLMLAMAAAVAGGAWQTRAWLLAGVRARLTRQYQQQVAALSEPQAVRLVRRLAHSDGEWLEVLVAAAADERVAVAAAAEIELRELVDRWAALPPADCSIPVAKLADLLARQSPQLSAERRHLAHSLAQRLIEWPVDGRRANAARLIADCEAVLLLPRTESPEIRVAAAPATPSTEPLPASPPPIALPEPPIANPAMPPAPEPIPATDRALPEEPRRFNAPRPIRISDD